MSVIHTFLDATNHVKSLVIFSDDVACVSITRKDVMYMDLWQLRTALQQPVLSGGQEA